MLDICYRHYYQYMNIYYYMLLAILQEYFQVLNCSEYIQIIQIILLIIYSN